MIFQAYKAYVNTKINKCRTRTSRQNAIRTKCKDAINAKAKSEQNDTIKVTKQQKMQNGPATERAAGSGVRRDVLRASARRVYASGWCCCFSFCLLSCQEPLPTRISVVVPPCIPNNCRDIVTVYAYCRISLLYVSVSFA